MCNNELFCSLMEAEKKGDLNTIKYLTEQGADYTLKDNNLDTIFSIASQNGHVKIIEYLSILEKN